MNNKINIEFPLIFDSADKASSIAQREYILLIKLQLTFLLLSTILSVFTVFYRGFLLLVVISMLGSLFVTYLMKTRKKERIWFDGRAVAESIKTLSWRYMMGAGPFKKTLSAEEVDKLFIKSIKNVLEERKTLSPFMVSNFESGVYITSAMKEVRNLNYSKRLELYLQFRVQDQKKWYSDKCENNKKWEERLFIASFSFQVLAIIYIIFFFSQNWKINITSILSALATITITWLQVKQHQELAQAYGLAAQELSYIASISFSVKSEDTLSEYVNESENAISREHTLWVARRGQ
ncbi:DUF4231 domain-containing protein [Priestia megaterium]|uniref:DUF4231 domain-containing protein n=1 Tax=Priestia megaterium TaxID=1404 RepID=UPI0036DA4759